MGLLDLLQSKLELYRLEQRYARRKNRRTFTTGATYVDGEYVYDSASPTSASTGSSGVSSRKSVGRGLSWGSKRRSFWGGR
ncbi:MAG: hypothetical protein M1834_008836 [Cirrosporium novae-zelandiae]|nr:MAG: hypothetical protein M1834_008836 [Cirrosporium novae-zelandiae]